MILQFKNQSFEILELQIHTLQRHILINMSLYLEECLLNSMNHLSGGIVVGVILENIMLYETETGNISKE